MPPTVLLSAPPGGPADDLRGWLAAAGFAVRPHALGSAPAVDLAAAAAAVVDAADPPAAAAQTRRWRAELGDDLVPVVWVLPAADPDLAARGLDAGADAVLARPLAAGVFVAQVRAAARARAAAARVAARAAEGRLLGDQLKKAYAQLDRDAEAARRVRLAFLGRPLPAVPGAGLAVSHRPRARDGGDFTAAHPAGPGRVAFLVGDVLAPAPALLGRFAAEAAAAADGPGRMLAAANRELLRLGWDDQPLVGMLAGVFDATTGELTVARAGLPAPVRVPADGDPEAWAVPGPFLGTAETTYPTRTAVLAPGDRFLVGTDGTRPDGAPGPGGGSGLAAAAARHRGLAGQLYVDAVAEELLAQVRHEDDFTLLCLEFLPGRRGDGPAPAVTSGPTDAGPDS
ncbi:MAG: hypothetical protein C0501_16775 [Isosphaera sp.]|nr:hypothetical protein [Isosphaera sp.]